MKKRIISCVSALSLCAIISGGAMAKDADKCDICNFSVSNLKQHSKSECNVKDVISDLLSGKDFKFDSSIADIIDAWISENFPGTGIQKPENNIPETTPDNNIDSDENENVPEKPEVNLPSKPESDSPQKPPVNNDSNNNSGSQNSSFEKRVVELVNQHRKEAGLSALRMDSTLNKGALIRAKETVTSFSHTRPDGKSCFTVLDELGYPYRTAGENIAYGQSSPEAVVNAWMNSEGHRANILNANYTKIGVGCHSNGGTLYWAQFFAS